MACLGARPWPLVGHPMKALICGSRTWENDIAVRDRLRALPVGWTIIHGASRGADQLAAVIARAIGIPEKAYPADWRGKGKRAGIIRNLQMLDENPDLVIAFWDERSTGTKHTIDEARRRGIPVEVITP